jgi:hypothetical protein
MADDREYGSKGGEPGQGGQRRQPGTQPGQGQGDQADKQQDDDRSQRGSGGGSGEEGKRDTGTSDRGVERSDWNYGDPAEEAQSGQRSRDKGTEQE